MLRGSELIEREVGRGSAERRAKLARPIAFEGAPSSMSKKDSHDPAWLTTLGLLAGAAAGYLAWHKLNQTAGPSFRLRSRRPETAVVTGASSGIGAVYARKLASLGYDLVLVARREDRLRTMATELTEGHGVHTEVLAADLALERDLQRLEDRIVHSDSMTVLVNNAGFGYSRDFVELSPEEIDRLLDVHLRASVRLSRAVLPGFLQRSRGAIVNVSSLAGFMALPGAELYAASKGFLTTFSRALGRQWAGSGVVVQALCPGLTRTEFHQAAGYPSDTGARWPWAWMSAREVVEASLAGLELGRSVVIPGAVNQACVAILATPLEGVLNSLISRRRRSGLQQKPVLH